MSSKMKKKVAFKYKYFFLYKNNEPEILRTNNHKTNNNIYNMKNKIFKRHLKYPKILYKTLISFL